MAPKGLDKFHQPLKYEVAGPNATSNSVELLFPAIIPSSESASTRVVNEITKIVYDFSGLLGVIPDFVAAQASQDISGVVTYSETTVAERALTGGATTGNSKVIDRGVFIKQGAFTATGTYGSFSTDAGHIVHDLTDEDGYGILTAGRSVFLALRSNVNASTCTVGVAIYYRQHKVSLTEYVGIFAARQQNPTA